VEQLIMDIITIFRWLEFAGMGLFFSVLAALPFLNIDNEEGDRDD